MHVRMEVVDVELVGSVTEIVVEQVDMVVLSAKDVIQLVQPVPAHISIIVCPILLTDSNDDREDVLEQELL